jgi:hypothetical protein
MQTGIDELLGTVTRVANTLRGGEIPFAVAGGCAVYARGGPASDHDVDIFVKPADAQRARRALVRAGLRAVDPPEDRLTKVYDGDILVDLVFQPNQRAVTDALLARASTLKIGSTVAPVISATDLVIDELMVPDSRRLDFTVLLQTARELREQVDWWRVSQEAGMSPYARAFLGLLDDLCISRDETPATDDLLPQYVAADLRRVLAEDPRTAELGVHVSVRDNAVVLCGEVAGMRRRLQLEDVVREHAPKLPVHNDIRVLTPDLPGDHQRLG